jgi:hypothetical protein
MKQERSDSRVECALLLFSFCALYDGDKTRYLLLLLLRTILSQFVAHRKEKKIIEKRAHLSDTKGNALPS